MKKLSISLTLVLITIFLLATSVFAVEMPINNTTQTSTAYNPAGTIQSGVTTTTNNIPSTQTNATTGNNALTNNTTTASSVINNTTSTTNQNGTTLNTNESTTTLNTPNLVDQNPLNFTNDNTTDTTVETISSNSNSDGLTASDIINILLIVVGVVIVFLGIAVLIRISK